MDQDTSSTTDGSQGEEKETEVKEEGKKDFTESASIALSQIASTREKLDALLGGNTSKTEAFNFSLVSSPSSSFFLAFLEAKSEIKPRNERI